MTPHGRVLLSRWLWIILLFAAGLVTFALAGSLVGPTEPFPSWSRFPAWLIWAYVTLGGFLLMVLAESIVRPRWSQRRAFFLWPPIWLPIALTTIAAWLVAEAGWLAMLGPSFDAEAHRLFVGLTGGSLFVLAVGRTLWSRIHATPDGTGSSTPAGSSASITDFDALKRWAQDDTEIVAPADDRFDHLPIAKRIAERLTRPWGMDASVALVGRLGSGKSGIIRLVEYELCQRRVTANTPRVILKAVSCWGFENSMSALEHTLRALVSKLEEEADCVAVCGVPGQYRDMVSSTTVGWFGAFGLTSLGQLITDGQGVGPQQQIARLGRILEALRLRLVLVLEDVDRNPSSAFNPEHIWKLLWALKRTPGLTFVLALSPDYETVDLAKLCDSIEVLPTLHREHVRRALAVLVAGCLDAYADQDLPVADVPHKRRLIPFLSGDAKSLAWLEFFDVADRNAVLSAIVALLETPRMLKLVVRHVIEIWGRLHGELDLEDLLMMTTLRHGAPMAFDYLVRHMDAIRAKPIEAQSEQKTPHPLWIRWGTLLTSEREAGAITALVRAMNLDETRIAADNDFLVANVRGNIERLQGVHRRHPTDYWSRLLAEELATTEVRDQSVLQHIAAWRSGSGSNAELVRGLYEGDDRYIAVWQHLAGPSFEPDGLRQLAQEIVMRLLDEHGARAHANHEGLRAVLGLITRGGLPVPGDADATWLGRLAAHALGLSVHMTAGLYGYWTHPKRGFVDSERRALVRQNIIEAAHALFAADGNPQRGATALVAALDETEPRALRHLIFPPGEASAPTEPAEWSWIAPTLLSAIRLRPELALHQISRLVIPDTDAPRDIDIQFVSRLFGSLEREFWVAVAEHAGHTDAWVASLVRFAQRHLAGPAAPTPGVSS